MIYFKEKPFFLMPPFCPERTGGLTLSFNSACGRAKSCFGSFYGFAAKSSVRWFYFSFGKANPEKIRFFQVLPYLR
jgi:hypothetical protein